MKIGYAVDATGSATERLEILAETTDGRYVVRHYDIVQDLYGRPFITTGSLQLRQMRDVKDIHEVVILVPLTKDREIVRNDLCPGCGVHKLNWRGTFGGEPCCEYETKRRRKELVDLGIILPILGNKIK